MTNTDNKAESGCCSQREKDTCKGQNVSFIVSHHMGTNESLNLSADVVQKFKSPQVTELHWPQSEL